MNLATLSMAKCSQLSSSWQQTSSGKRIDWKEVDRVGAAPPEAERVVDFPPSLVPQAFDVFTVLDGDPIGFENVLRALSPQLPAQMHLQPCKIADVEEKGTSPLFRRVVEALRKVPEVEPMLHEACNIPTEEGGGSQLDMKREWWWYFCVLLNNNKTLYLTVLTF